MVEVSYTHRPKYSPTYKLSTAGLTPGIDIPETSEEIRVHGNVIRLNWVYEVSE